MSHLPPPVPGGVAPKFGSEKVSRYTGVSQVQLRVSRYTVQQSLAPKLFQHKLFGPHPRHPISPPPPQKKCMCLISWERTQTWDPHKFFEGIFGATKGVPNRPFLATKGLVYCSFPALTGVRGVLRGFLESQPKSIKPQSANPYPLKSQLENSCLQLSVLLTIVV